MAGPTNTSERKMATTLAQNEEEDIRTQAPETPEELVARQDRNLREIRITHRRYKNSPDLQKTLEQELEKGKGTDFPADATIREDTSQAAVRRSDNSKTVSGSGVNVPGTEDHPRAPNIQVTSVQGPNAFEKGIESLKGFVEQNRDVVNNLINDVTRSTDEAVAAHEKAAGAVLAGGLAKAAEATITGTIEASGAATRERILKAANLDTRATDNLFATTLADRLKLSRERSTLGAEIDAREAVGLFDDPINYIINQTVLPGQVAQYNAVATKENDLGRELRYTQDATKVQESLDLGATSDLYLMRAVQSANAEVAMSTAKAEELRAQSKSLVASKVLTIAGLRDRQINFQETLSKWEVALADKREGQQKKTEELEDERDKDRRVRTIGTLIGNNMASFRWLKGQGKDVQEAWARRAGTLSLGDSLAEASEFVRRFGDLNNMRTGGAGELADMFKAFFGEIDKRATNIQNTWAATHPGQETKVPKSVEARQLAADQMQAEWEGQRDINMFGADQVNPYKINHKKEYLTYRGDKNNPVYLMVKDAYKQNVLVDDKQLIGAVIQLVGDGTMQPREASAAIAEYYGDSVRRNNGDRNIKNMGMDAQENYRVRPVGSNISIDLMNPTSVENYFTKELAISKARATGFIVPEGMEVAKYPSTETYYLKYPEKPVVSDNKEVLTAGAKERKKTAAGKTAGVQ